MYDVGKIKESIKVLEVHCLLVASISPEAQEAFKIALEVLRKQIPQRPIIEAWSPAQCPTCGASLSESRGDGYCKHLYGKDMCDCGQQIEWDD